MDILLEVDISDSGYEFGDPKVKDVSLAIRPGKLTGLIGANGAGKSTVLKTILGIMPYAEASIRFKAGYEQYAYIPEHPVFYENLTLWEHLDLAAAVYGMGQHELELEGERLLDRFRMTEARHHLPGGFSKGMRQKMMLMIGFLSRPDIYIVDEPFIGLDPRAIKDFLSLLEEERQRGAGILMSTHVLDTAERICDDFVLISQGRIAAQGTLEEIRSTAAMPEASLFDCFDRLAD
ncbi:ABC transporter ATP-binding protein [Paenibacillus lentus]|uniref:ABC transporter ATP-binding protein n=1 Tax=Paenibacillus lentus TaxID=1338368 RepID=A0A3S8RPH6_9BACL|nr:ABC transporter ATP-binding protein [Paenibacillus lentus]AZK44850.1 ABC transporter ATP-binding protein [Paenibacillus lentus]